MSENKLTFAKMRELDGTVMTVHDLIYNGLTESPYLRITVESTGEKVEPDNLIKYSGCSGKFAFYEDDDGADSDGRRIIIPVLYFEIGGK